MFCFIASALELRITCPACPPRRRQTSTAVPGRPAALLDFVGAEQAGAVEVGLELGVQFVEFGLVVLEVLVGMGRVVLGDHLGGRVDLDPGALPLT